MAAAALNVHPKIGGKNLLVDWLYSLFPIHYRFVDAFGGAGNVLINKPRSHEEVYVDKDWNQYNLMLTVQRDHDGIIETLQQWDVDDFFGLWADRIAGRQFTDLEYAALYFVQQNLSRGHGRRVTRAFVESNLPTLWNKVNNLHKIAERLKGVLILHGDALALLPALDTPTTLAYCDPPYVHSTRLDKDLYDNEMSDHQHVQLLDIGKAYNGMFCVSGHHSDLYEQHLEGWSVATKKRAVNGIYGPYNRYLGRSREVVEHLWMNW